MKKNDYAAILFGIAIGTGLFVAGIIAHYLISRMPAQTAYPTSQISTDDFILKPINNPNDMNPAQMNNPKSQNPIQTKEIHELIFSETAQPLDDANEVRFSPVSGIIKRIIIDWSEQSKKLVEVIFNHKTYQLLPYPSKEGLMLIGTHEFRLNRPIRQHDAIEMKIFNHDTNFQHVITAVVQIEET